MSFEIDSSQPPPTETDWTEQAYTNEELFEHLKGECVLQDDEDDEELVSEDRCTVVYMYFHTESIRAYG